MEKDLGPPPIVPSRDGGRRSPYPAPRRQGAGQDGAREDDHGREHEGARGGGADHLRSEGATDVTIAGLAADKLSPEIERVIENLLAELGQVRGELDAARRRLAQLEQVVDHHPYLPVLSRQAFRGQVAHVRGRLQEFSFAPSLFVISLINGDAIRHEFGIAARDKALGLLCDALRAVVAPGDFVGSLTGNELAALAFVADEASRAALRAALARAVAERPFVAGARRVDLDVAVGLAVLSAGSDVDGLIAAADANLMAGIRGQP
jgi:GGDEF domain-containing protein